VKIQSKLPNGYTTLLNRVKKILIEGLRRIEAQRVRTYWETGKLIHTDILKNKGRAGYGDQVVLRLANDLDVDRTVLNRCVKFAEVYPRLPIGARGHQFKWSHYRKLITVTDDKKRLTLEREVIRNDWTVDQLAGRIKKERPELTTGRGQRTTSNEQRARSYKPLIPLRGELYTYQIVKRLSLNAGQTAELLVDLGFGIFRNIDRRLVSGFASGDVVESRPKEDAYKFTKTKRTAKDLYTYAAFVERVIDGDTLKVRLDLGFDTLVRQTLRLRGIDCPEMDTGEGLRAKGFVQSHIKQWQTIIVRSSRSDKYDRYLADIFIPTSNEQRTTSNEIYLNNVLLEHGHAVRI
jgi:endonuclease YncB( thermonuclease family)